MNAQSDKQGADLPAVDIAIVGAGAAGLMAAIFAGRAARERGLSLRIVALDGARTLGAKILVAGGGRCNVTHHAVDESAYAGSSRHAIRNVLKRFDVPETIIFFKELGVELKREETGKLFPVSDDAHTVLSALLRAASNAGVEIRHPWRVASVERDGPGFVITGTASDASPPARLRARSIILATGGMSLPKSGSDGHGYALARALGHTTTPRVFPSLVPLLLPKDHPLCGLSGLTHRATLELRAAGGKRLQSFTNSMLCTHFGLSGPAVLDISRYYLDALARARAERGPEPSLVINWLVDQSAEQVDRQLEDAARTLRLSVGRWIVEHAGGEIAERLARVLCGLAGVDPAAPLHSLTRTTRRAVASALCELPLPITGDRGFTAAEVTAGGVPLAEIELKTMQSRPCPGLFLCGEILDVDGRIGGFNFQWAWASGHVAGASAAARLADIAAGLEVTA